MVFTDDGILMEVSDGHSSKALFSILSTDEGRSILTRLEHPQKAPSPMIFTEDGILIEVSDEQPAKASPLILSTDEGLSKLIVVRHEQS